MKIKTLRLKNFMIFKENEIDWSKNINIICGENSTGKTTLLKVMYSMLKPIGRGKQDVSTKEIEEKKGVTVRILKLSWRKTKKFPWDLAMGRKIMPT